MCKFCQLSHYRHFTAFFFNGTTFFFLNFGFIYLWLCWVFISVRGLSLVAASGGHSSSRCAGLSLSWPLLLRSTGSRRAGSVTVAHGPSCSTACGIFPDQGSNPCSLRWQADSQPLRHQGSPIAFFFFFDPGSYILFTCHVSLVSFNLDTSLSFKTLTLLEWRPLWVGPMLPFQ